MGIINVMSDLMNVPSVSQLKALFHQFFHFGMVGAVGFIIDWSSTTFLKTFMPLKVAVLFAYLIAASGTWFLNRVWTFRHIDHSSVSVLQQWKRFLLANLPGFVINRGIVLLVLSYITITQHWPVIALMCGTACGMFVNFTLCKTCVFTSEEQEESETSSTVREEV